MKKQNPKKPAAGAADALAPTAGAPDPFDPPPDPFRVRRFVELLDEWERKAATDDWPEYADALAAVQEAEPDARAELAARGENPAALLSHDPADWEWERLCREEFSLDPAAFAAAKKVREARPPSNAADVETVARIEAKVDELAARKRKGKPLGKRCEVSWKTAAGELGLSARTLQRYAANPGSVPDSLRGFCRAVLRTRTAFDTWRAGLGTHEGAKARMKEAADRLGGNYRGMRVGRRP